jgi:hypothetical protein
LNVTAHKGAANGRSDEMKESERYKVKLSDSRAINVVDKL